MGLGNPGPEYEETRHNLGFWILDRLAARWKAGSWRRAGERLETRATVGGRVIVLAKPLTWMNRSGIAVRALCEALECQPGDLLRWVP